VSATAAAGLARLRVLFPGWVLRRVDLESWSGYIARRARGGRLIIAEKSLAALELALRRKGAPAMTPGDLDTMRDIAALFYAAGRAARADVLCLPPRISDRPPGAELPARHLSVVRWPT